MKRFPTRQAQGKGLAIFLIVLLFSPLPAFAKFPIPIVSDSTLLPIAQLDENYFRHSESYLSEEDFQTKWTSVRATSALEMARSFVSIYWRDVKALPTVGPIGICSGDRHFENFGFIGFQEGTEFVYNDLDDSGYCPAAFDALRYFVLARLNDGRKNATHLTDLATFYTDVLVGEAKGISPSSDETPDLNQVRKKKLDKYVDGNRFIVDAHGGDLTPISPKEREEITNAVSNVVSTSIWDVAVYTKAEGGSGGLRRYWILKGDSSKRDRDILELKQEVMPATAVGNWGVDPMPRIEWAARSVWTELTPRYFITVSLSQGDFLLRSRAEQGIKYKKIDDSKVKHWEKAELSVMAAQDAANWRGDWTSRSNARAFSNEFSHWLVASSQVLADRYQAVFDKISSRKK